MLDVPDAEFVAAVLAGEVQSFAGLVRRYEAAFYRHALWMTGDPDAAADLVQDAFIKAYVRLAELQDPARFSAWVFSMVRNGCMDYLKNIRRKARPLSPDLPDGEAPDALARLEQTQERRAIERALLHLRPAQREAFLLRHVEELPYEVMADRLGVSVTALKMRVLRAREALQATLRRSR